MVSIEDPRRNGPKPQLDIETRSVPVPLTKEEEEESTLGTADEHVTAAVPTKPWERPGVWGTTRRYLRTFRGYIWDDPDKPKEEKWFLFKLDFFLLTTSCLGYFSRGLDVQNINNAYVSGMKESLKLYGSELTYASNVNTAGYVIGQIPAVILVTRVRPSILIPTVEIVWAALTFCTAAVKTAEQLYAVRFFIGLFESAFFPVMVYLIGSWYTKEERAKRVTIFYATASMSSMFSGYLQAGAYKGLDGKLGREGWSWLFIICGVISLPIGILGYFFIPDFPETTRAFYLTPKEAQFARDRLVKAGLKPLGASAWDRKKIFRIMSQWQFWLLPLGYFFIQGSFPAYQPVFALWLKSTHHSVYQINVWPTGQVAIGVVVQVVAGMVSDSRLLRGRRWQTIMAMQAVTFFSCVVLAVWDVSDNLKFTAYYLMYFSCGVPGIYYSWYPDLIPHDHEMRGFVIACSNMFSFIQSIWFSVAVWRTIDAPRYHPGFIFASVLGVMVVLHTILVRTLEKRDTKKRALAQDGLTDVESPIVVLSDSEKEAGSSEKKADGSEASASGPDGTGNKRSELVA
ncbi:hypothetical protein A1O3_03367 [Capronia epimyces CBS 606.96]|uniref:Major facilitator superfamily (MFS) profile domain-containing protein n=1 Tax=Capronia epimyces CBS 606.96 TaxID=1182542 RepID=W9YB07_9EURO|nr:uncharacterized protein A1O3_03367 [Capronia epimyces CBS 606.96]EXJ86416.1 hypothetical protein A1O3_03367 [Capronia epimyces CBS 606.96]